MRPRRLRKTLKLATRRRGSAFFTLVQCHEPPEHFIDPAARLHDEMLATLPPLPPRRARRHVGQLELWPTRERTRELELATV
jgi:hypothetical protein